MKFAAAVVMRLHVRVAEMAVGIDERGHDRLAGQVDTPGAPGRLKLTLLSNPCERAVFDQECRVGDSAVPSPVMSCAPSNRTAIWRCRWGRRICRRRGTRSRHHQEKRNSRLGHEDTKARSKRITFVSSCLRG